MDTKLGKQSVSLSLPHEKPSLPSPQRSLLLLGLGIAIILSLVTSQIADLQMLWLLWLGLGLGYTLFHARFGFTSAFRRFASVGNGEGIRAHMIMLAAATTLFAPILALNLSFFGEDVSGYVSQVGVGMLFGAFLFGIGMQLGGG